MIHQLPNRISLVQTLDRLTPSFETIWRTMMDQECHRHCLWQEPFIQHLKTTGENAHLRFKLATVWALNMVLGSYCFPGYVASLAARAESDVVRHGLLENAWDESGGEGHTKRSHFWLAVRLARLLGFSDQAIAKIQVIPAAKIYITAHQEGCASREFDFGLGMISLIEEFTTPEFTLIRDVLIETCEGGLGLNSQEFRERGGEDYFNANIEDDERHREEMPLLVAALLKEKGVDLTNPGQIKVGLRGVRDGIRYSIDLRGEFFGGIYNFVIDEGSLESMFSEL